MMWFYQAAAALFPLLWLSLFPTCCFSFPSVMYRRAYQYYPMMADPGNQWDVAQEPLAYDQPEDYYDTNQFTDVEALSNLLEAYDNSRWGRIVNEMPEEDIFAERELRELKRASKPVLRFSQSQHPQTLEKSYEQANMRTKAAATTVAAAAAAEAAAVSSVSPLTTVAPESARRTGQVQSEQSQPIRIPLGQKEIPMLRPPTHFRVNKPSAEPAIISAHLASSERQKKPSPYDTLREYLSIEDALKKEAAKRRVEMRHEKRSGKRFVADEATLTGQLNNLKKSIA